MAKNQKDYDPLFNVRMPEELLAVLDELRRVEKDIPTRSEMMRRLVQRAGDGLQGKRK